MSGISQFVPDLPVLLTFAVASIVMAITPGPDMALFVSRTIRYGLRHGFVTVSGALTGIACHTLLAAAGVSLLILAAPAAFTALKMIGAAYLIWLAIGAIRGGSGFIVTEEFRSAPRLRTSYLTGLGINLANPKMVVFFVTFLPQFVSPTDPTAWGKLVFLGFFFIFLSLPLVVGMVVAARWISKCLSRRPWIQKALNWSFASVFVAFAISILTAEARREPG